MSEHVFPADVVHHDWDRSRPAALTITSGDIVHYDLRMAGHGQLDLGDSFSDARLDLATMYHLAGPVAIDGALPGDTIAIEVLELTPGDWGWTAILPGLGLLPDDFPVGVIRTFPLANRTAVDFAPGVQVPLRPFLGTLGTAPDVEGSLPPFPPHRGGGNVDTRHLVAGSILWLPVHLPGAQFSVGDPHATQGDGEVCVSALECPMRASLRFTLHRRRTPSPTFMTPAEATPTPSRGEIATMGIAADLYEGARIATRAMITWLGANYALEPADAYMLCSLVGDLRIFEIVDDRMWNVGMCVPLEIFGSAVQNQVPRSRT